MMMNKLNFSVFSHVNEKTIKHNATTL